MRLPDLQRWMRGWSVRGAPENDPGFQRSNKNLELALSLSIALALSLSVMPASTGEATTSGAVIYKADAERAFTREWSGFTAAGAERFTRVTSPRAQGAYAWRVDLHDGDPGYVNGDPGQGNFPERSEMNAHYDHQLFQENQERFISFQIYLPKSYPLDDNHRQTIFQTKWGCNGPPISLEVTAGVWRVVRQQDNVCSNSNPTNLRSVPAIKGQWARFTFHIKFSPNPDVGFVKVYANVGDGVNRTIQPKTFTSTMKQSNGAARPLGIQTGYYRWVGQTGDTFVVLDGLTVATTRAEAEANAFGP